MRHSEGADLFDRESDVFFHLIGHFGGAGVHLLSGDKDRAIPFVQHFGVMLDRRFALGLYPGQHFVHHALRFGRIGFRRLLGFFQIGRRHLSFLCLGLGSRAQRKSGGKKVVEIAGMKAIISTTTSIRTMKGMAR